MGGGGATERRGSRRRGGSDGEGHRARDRGRPRPLAAGPLREPRRRARRAGRRGGHDGHRTARGQTPPRWQLRPFPLRPGPVGESGRRAAPLGLADLRRHEPGAAPGHTARLRSPDRPRTRGGAPGLRARRRHRPAHRRKPAGLQIRGRRGGRRHAWHRADQLVDGESVPHAAPHGTAGPDPRWRCVGV